MTKMVQNNRVTWKIIEGANYYLLKSCLFKYLLEMLQEGRHFTKWSNFFNVLTAVFLLKVLSFQPKLRIIGVDIIKKQLLGLTQ